MQPLTQYEETHQFSNTDHEVVVLVKVVPLVGPQKAYTMITFMKPSLQLL